MASEDLETRGANNRGNGSRYLWSPFYQDTTEKQWTSWLIPVFVVANVVMFIVTMYINNCPKNNSGLREKCMARVLGRFSFQPLRENPLIGPSSSTVEKLGALEWNKVVHGHQGWRLVSCFWLHTGVIHLLGNMSSLLVIGIGLERQFGFVRIGVIYLLSGFGGTLLSCLFLRSTISLGASGAVFGLLGAMLSELIANWTIYSNKAIGLLAIVITIVINLAVGLLPFVDNFGHIGGVLSGFLLGFILLLRPQFGWVECRNFRANVRAKPIRGLVLLLLPLFAWVERRNLPVDFHAKSKYKAYQYVLLLISLVSLIVGFTVGLVMLFRGVDAYKLCHWCHYLNCIPTKKWHCWGN